MYQENKQQFSTFLYLANTKNKQKNKPPSSGSPEWSRIYFKSLPSLEIPLKVSQTMQ